jgi:hypothetical protein
MVSWSRLYEMGLIHREEYVGTRVISNFTFLFIRSVIRCILAALARLFKLTLIRSFDSSGSGWMIWFFSPASMAVRLVSTRSQSPDFKLSLGRLPGPGAGKRPYKSSCCYLSGTRDMGGEPCQHVCAVIHQVKASVTAETANTPAYNTSNSSINIRLGYVIATWRACL